MCSLDSDPYRGTCGLTRGTCGLVRMASFVYLAHVPRVARIPHAPPPAWLMCHAWPVRRTLRPLPGARATRGMHTARSAARLAHVPRVACTPHTPPPAWRTCHPWHAHRRRRNLPGACATRGTHAARSAARLAHVPRVVCTPHAPHVPHVACTSRPHLSYARCPLLPPTHILARQPPADECVLSQAGSAASDSTHSDEPSASSAW